MIRSNSTDFLLRIWIIYYIYMILIGIVIPVGSFIGVFFNIYIFIISLYYGFLNNRFFNSFLYVYVFIIYVFILILLNSSDFVVSYKDWIKLSIGLLHLPIGYFLFKDETSRLKIWRFFVIILSLYILNSLLANIFHFGGGYAKIGAEYETGNLFAAALFSNVYIFTILPFYLIYDKRINKKQISICIICIVLTIINMKRTPIACLITSVIMMSVFYYYFNYKYGKIRNNFVNVKIYYFIAFLTFFVGLLFFGDTIKKQIESRQDRFQTERFDKEGRFLEFQYVKKEILDGNDFLKTCFGKETFNTVGTYANGKFRGRMIHQDFTLLLHSTGVFGILFYLLIHIYLISIIIKKRRYIDFENDKFSRLLFSIYITYSIIHLISMLSGAIRELFSSMIFYLITGVILRYFDEQDRIGIYGCQDESYNNG